MNLRLSHAFLRALVICSLVIGMAVSNVSLVVYSPSVANAALTQSGDRATSPTTSIGFNKAVYKKDAVAPTGGGVWTTGDAGKNYRENQWVFYQYQITGVNSTTIVDFDVAFNHLQTNTSAIFVDAFANFRACLDGSCDQTNASGPMANMLQDQVPYPTTSTTNWKIVPVPSVISNVNHTFDTGTNSCGGTDALNTPSEFHCFSVNGSALATLVALPATGSHTLTLFYEAHLASSAVWQDGLEVNLGSYDGVGAEALPAGVLFGTDAYTNWTTSAYNGAGYATGSSRHFTLEGPGGAITLPIPAVPAPSGSITITKVTDPAAATGVSFAFTGTFPTFTLDTDPSLTYPNTKTFTVLGGGFPFSFTESAPASGWTLTDLVCNSTKGTNVITPSVATRTVTITLDLDGGDVACTFTNARQTSLTLAKHVINDAGGTANASAWTLAATGTSGSFSGTGTPATGADASITHQVTAGVEYTLSETGTPTGYTAGTTWSCTGDTTGYVSPNKITLQTGQSATCTITNNDTDPQLHLRKLVTNNNGGSAVAGDWTLTATGTGASPTNLSGSTPVDSTTGFKADTYALGETGPTGYAGTWNCGTATMPDGTHVVVPLGGNITCTITNDDNAAQLIVIKHVVNDNGGTAVASAWTMSITGVTTSGSSTFAGAESPGVTKTLTTVGNYAVNESATPAGYSATYSADCTGTIALGETKTCTITNNDIAPSLHLRKVVVNNNGGTAVNTAWTLTATGATTITGHTPVDSGATFSAGTYTLAESDGATGYSTTGWSCVKNSAAPATGASITLALGDNATCTITNDDIAAHLIVIKHVINDNDGSENSASAWTMTIVGVTATGGNSFAGAESPGVDKTLTSVGGYSVTEDGPANYTPSYSADCTGTIALGQTKTCTVTNDDNAPGLHLRKIVINDNGGTAAATDWTLTATGTTTLSGTTPVDSDGTFVGGTYTLSESGGPTGYTASSWVCVGGTQVGTSITVALGDSVTCTITNNDVAPALHLRKIVTNDNGGTAVATDWTLSATGPTAIGGTTPVDSGTTFAAGTYALAESGGGNNYTASGWSCGEATMTDETHVVVGLGDDITCTITNDDVAAHLIVIKHVVGGQNVASDFTMTITGVTAAGAQSFAGHEAPGTDTTLTTIGSYSVNEAGLGRYSAFYSPDCSGTIALGETKTCTVTNTFIPDNPTGNLTVTKYNDLNGNGTRDAGEPALGGWTFSLSINGIAIGTLTTDATGSATRTGLAPATYVLVETLQNGWTSTDPGTGTPTKSVVVNGNATSTVLFGNKAVTLPPTTQGGTITVTKYEDANANKQRETGEAALAGWTFTITNDHGTVVATITTAAFGSALAQNLPPGVYTVTETTQTGWVSTDPGGSAPSKQVLVEAGQTISVIFGNAKVQLPSTSTGGDTPDAIALFALALGLGFVAIRRRIRGI